MIHSAEFMFTIGEMVSAVGVIPVESLSQCSFHLGVRGAGSVNQLGPSTNNTKETNKAR